MDTVNYCRQMFWFDLPSIIFAHRTEKSTCKLIQCDNYMIRYVIHIFYSPKSAQKMR